MQKPRDFQSRRQTLLIRKRLWDPLLVKLAPVSGASPNHD